MVDLVISLYGLILVLIGLFEENKQSFVALSNSNISHAVPSMQCLHMSNYILYERKQYILSISNFKMELNRLIITIIGCYIYLAHCSTLSTIRTLGLNLSTMLSRVTSVPSYSRFKTVGHLSG